MYRKFLSNYNDCIGEKIDYLFVSRQNLLILLSYQKKKWWRQEDERTENKIYYETCSAFRDSLVLRLMLLCSSSLSSLACVFVRRGIIMGYIFFFYILVLFIGEVKSAWSSVSSFFAFFDGSCANAPPMLRLRTYLVCVSYKKHSFSVA